MDEKEKGICAVKKKKISLKKELNNAVKIDKLTIKDN